MVGLILNRIANITGTTINVSTVAKPRPAIIVIAIEPKKASNTSGIRCQRRHAYWTHTADRAIYNRKIRIFARL